MAVTTYEINGLKFSTSDPDPANHIRKISSTLAGKGIAFDPKSLGQKITGDYFAQNPEPDEGRTPVSTQDKLKMQDDWKALHYLGDDNRSGLGGMAKTYQDKLIDTLSFGQSPHLYAATQALAPFLANTPNAQDYIGKGDTFGERYNKANELQEMELARQEKRNPYSAGAGMLTAAALQQKAITDPITRAMFGAAPATSATLAGRLGQSVVEGGKQGIAGIPLLQAHMPGDSSLKDRALMTAVSPVAGAATGPVAQLLVGEPLNALARMAGGVGASGIKNQMPEKWLSTGTGLPKELLQVEEGQTMSGLTRAIKIMQKEGIKGDKKEMAAGAKAAGQKSMEKLADSLEGKDIKFSDFEKNIKRPQNLSGAEEDQYNAVLAEKLAGIKKNRFGYKQKPGQDVPDEVVAPAKTVNQEKMDLRQSYADPDKLAVGANDKKATNILGDAAQATIEGVSPEAKELNQDWFIMDQLKNSLEEMGAKGKAPVKGMSGLEKMLVSGGLVGAGARPENALEILGTTLGVGLGARALDAGVPILKRKWAVPLQNMLESAVKTGGKRVGAASTSKTVTPSRLWYEERRKKEKK